MSARFALTPAWVETWRGTAQIEFRAHAKLSGWVPEGKHLCERGQDIRVGPSWSLAEGWATHAQGKTSGSGRVGLWSLQAEETPAPAGHGG